MARKLEHFPAVSASRYPWHDLLDGNPWELTQGEDFKCKPMTFINNARSQAKRRGGTTRSRLFQNGDRTTVVIQFYTAATR